MAHFDERFRAPAIGVLALAALLIALFLFPADSDGSFASFDGVVYGFKAERGESEPARAFHPLFHAIVIPLTSLLREAGVASPGHVAIRIVSGAGAAAIVLLVAGAAGSRRWLAGLGFAASLLATRGFVVDAAVGETILPGCAAALFAIDQATRSPLRPARVWCALALALLLRADNVLIVPGVALAAWSSLPVPRTRRVLAGLAATAAATALGYLAFWWFATGGHPPPWQYFFPATVASWTGAEPLDAGRLLIHADALGAAVTGRTWPRQHPNLWIGPAFIAVQLAAAALLRGSGPAWPVIAAVVPCVILRAALYCWFDAWNPEWSIATLALVAFLGARLARGEPRRPVPLRIAGGVLLVLLAAATLAAHGPFTLRLRERRFIGAMRQAADAGAGGRFVTIGPSADLAFRYLNVDHVALQSPADLADPVAAIRRELGSQPAATVVVFERRLPWMVSGDPHLMIDAPAARTALDALELPGLTVLRWEGSTYALRLDPSDSRR